MHNVNPFQAPGDFLQISTSQLLFGESRLADRDFFTLCTHTHVPAEPSDPARLTGQGGEATRIATSFVAPFTGV